MFLDLKERRTRPSSRFFALKEDQELALLLS
jgi:hypothetical protein